MPIPLLSVVCVALLGIGNYTLQVTKVEDSYSNWLADTSRIDSFYNGGFDAFEKLFYEHLTIKGLKTSQKR